MLTPKPKNHIAADDVGLQPLDVNTNPGPEYAPHTRLWQGVPTIERAANGRLWATWFAGVREKNENYSVLATSGDDGKTWTDPSVVVDPPSPVLAINNCLWIDPTGKLWWTWTQSAPAPLEHWDGRGGIWAITTDNPGDANPQWSEPRRLFHGVALNKPIVAASGTWIWPMSIWWFHEQFRDLDRMRRPGVIVSDDQGETWEWRGGAHMEDRLFDEPMMIQKRCGTLWMLSRSKHGISESFSMDDGYSWSVSRPSQFAGPSARFHIRRLASGRLLFLNHLGNPNRRRSHITAMLSDDDGATWPYRLLIDEREGISYPDAAEGPDGTLYITHDHDRYGEREILMSVVNEQDIIDNAPQRARLNVVISRGNEIKGESQPHYVHR